MSPSPKGQGSLPEVLHPSNDSSSANWDQTTTDDRRGRLPDESAHSLAVRVQNARGAGRRVDLPAPPEQRVVTTRTDQLSARYFDCLYNDASDPGTMANGQHTKLKWAGRKIWLNIKEGIMWSVERWGEEFG